MISNFIHTSLKGFKFHNLYNNLIHFHIQIFRVPCDHLVIPYNTLNIILRLRLLLLCLFVKTFTQVIPSSVKPILSLLYQAYTGLEQYIYIQTHIKHYITQEEDPIPIPGYAFLSVPSLQTNIYPCTHSTVPATRLTNSISCFSKFDFTSQNKAQ